MGVEVAHLLFSAILFVLIPWWWRYFVPYAEVNASEGTVEKPRYSEFFAFIRGVAIVAVVVVHVTYFFVHNTDVLTSVQHILNNALRFAIAIFFIASGVLLSQPKWSLSWFGNFYRKRSIAVGVPYLLVVCVLTLLQGDSVQEGWYGFWTGTTAVPFYFVVVLFQLYLLYPFLYWLAQKRWFVFLTLAISLFSYVTWELRMFGNVYSFVPYLFFFIWGIYMRNHLLQRTAPFVWWPWVVLIALYFGLQIIDNPTRFYNGQFFYSIAIVMLLYNTYVMGSIPKRLVQVGAWLGNRSLWIFLTHFSLLAFLFPYFMAHWPGGEWSTFLGFLLVGTILSVLLGFLSERVYSGISTWIVPKK